MSTLRRGVVRAFDAVTWKANVELTEGRWLWMAGVPVAFHIDSTQLTNGAYCAVMVAENWNPAQSVVVALYHGVAPDLELEF